VFTYDDGLLANKLWEMLAEEKRNNVLLQCELHVAEETVTALQKDIEALKLAVSQLTAEKESEDVKGD
tara:strand:+ start:317 stop:520 length:204 start_codon:yes stop_codon:yes gene_type:complete